MPANWEKLRDGTLNWEIFQHRNTVLKAVRKFFDDRNFLEIEPPLMTPFPTLDSNIISVPVAYDAPEGTRSLFLHTSPEHAMKKLLAAGADRIVSIDKVFRNGEQTRLHNGEFTMVEWYRRGADYHDIMNDTEALVRSVAMTLHGSLSLTYQRQIVDLDGPWPRHTVSDLFSKHVGLPLDAGTSLEHLKKAALRHELPISNDDDWETLYFRLFLNIIEPKVGQQHPEWIVDYPASMGLMARRKDQQPHLAERAELYISGMELANGYSELLDSNEQLQRFKADALIKQQLTGTEYPIDFELVEALKTPLPPCSGMALGLDRLIMLLLDQDNIQDVLFFPIHQFPVS